MRKNPSHVIGRNAKMNCQEVKSMHSDAGAYLTPGAPGAQRVPGDFEERDTWRSEPSPKPTPPAIIRPSTCEGSNWSPEEPVGHPPLSSQSHPRAATRDHENHALGDVTGSSLRTNVV